MLNTLVGLDVLYDTPQPLHTHAVLAELLHSLDSHEVTKGPSSALPTSLGFGNARNDQTSMHPTEEGIVGNTSDAADFCGGESSV